MSVALINGKTIRVILWGFLILFLLNTLGNLFAKSIFEKSLAVLTLIFAILLGMILINRTLQKYKINSWHYFLANY